MPVQTVQQFSDITESPFTRASADQLQILCTRYALAAKHASGRDVIEVACGAGVGLGMLAGVARHVVGGDIDERNCAIARETYDGRQDIQVRQLDALHIPYPDASFDVVVLYEALYYLSSADAFLREAKRMLRPGGTLLISTVNWRWGEFNPSPFSTRYYDAGELADLLAQHGFSASIYGGFPEQTGGAVRSTIALVRKIAIRLHLIPRTQKSKEWLKRVFYGKLTEIPRELRPGFAGIRDLDPIPPPYQAGLYRFIYAVAVSCS